MITRAKKMRIPKACFGGAVGEIGDWAMRIRSYLGKQMSKSSLSQSFGSCYSNELTSLENLL